MRLWRLAIALLVMFLCGSSLNADIWTFTPLGYLPGGANNSRPQAVSADGSVVVGNGRSDSGKEVFGWTAATTMVGLGDWAGGSFDSNAFGISGDGSVIAGYGTSADGKEAFRWTEAEGKQRLGDLPGGGIASEGRGVSKDGSIVVGHGTSGNSDGSSRNEAFRWTQQSGMVGLGDLGEGSFNSKARAISEDSNVIVGYGQSADGREACRWTVDGPFGLGDLKGGAFNSVARAVSGDGAVIVGVSEVENGSEAFMWTETDGMVSLGDFDGGELYSRARGVSADGTIIVGEASTVLGHEAFIWDQSGGMQSLQGMLLANSVTLDDWRLTEAHWISYDGRHIVGIGEHADGSIEGWRVSRVPEPSTFVLFGIAGMGLGIGAWRRRRKSAH